ncbi:MAG: hypothetical protein E6I85_10150 [Chloroflexi bacterium]|nr:MAG: hypothetical protein E6I85_10150 [Chloroflexota bacterium]
MAVSTARPLAVAPSLWRRPPLWLSLGLALALVTLLPYLYAHLAAPSGRTFMGFFFLGDDANTYLAKMRGGFDGAWAWTNRYTTEPSQPVYFFVYWIALGHLAALLHLPLLVTFHAARALGAVLLLYAGWMFIEHFVEDPGARRWALFFMAFGLGMGYLLEAMGKPVFLGQKTDTLDWRMPELSAFYSILALPNFAWAAALQAIAAVLTLRAAERGSLKTGFFAGLAWLGEASIHAQMPILIGGAIVVAVLYRRVSARGYLAVALALAMVAPYVLYSYVELHNPEVSRWSGQWRNNFAPDLLSLSLALAPQLLLAALALPRMLRRRSRGDVFLLAWLLLLAVILWAPTPADNLRRRFFDGIYLPLVVMAAEGFFTVVLPRLRERGRRLLGFGYVSFASVGSLFLLLGPPLVISNPAYSVPNGDYAALQWLSPQPPGVVLTSDRLGLFVPAYTSDTTYVGQYSETYNWRVKTVEVNGLLHGQGDLQGFLVEHHVRYLVWSTEDTNVVPPSSLGTPAFTAKGVEVFQLY